MAQNDIYGYHNYYRDGFQWQFLDAPTNHSMFDGFHIGWEWELECGGSDFDNACKIAQALGTDLRTEDKLICAYDGSLTDGFELISQPVNIGFMLNEDGTGYNITDACLKADELGYSGQGFPATIRRGERGGHAGIHFNFGRAELGIHENPEHKLYCMLLNNYDWMYKKFSRREGTAYGWRYCPFPSGHNMERITPMTLRSNYEGTIRRLQDLAYDGRTHSVAINTSKDKVIEVRFMCSTTFPRYFLGACQLMYMMAWACKNLSLEQITAVGFPWFRQVARLNDFKDFIDTCEASRVDVDELHFPV